MLRRLIVALAVLSCIVPSMALGASGGKLSNRELARIHNVAVIAANDDVLLVNKSGFAQRLAKALAVVSPILSAAAQIAAHDDDYTLNVEDWGLNEAIEAQVSKDLASHYNVRSIPYDAKKFQDGKGFDFIGALNKDSFPEADGVDTFFLFLQPMAWGYPTNISHAKYGDDQQEFECARLTLYVVDAKTRKIIVRVQDHHDFTNRTLSDLHVERHMMSPLIEGCGYPYGVLDKADWVMGRPVGPETLAKLKSDFQTIVAKIASDMLVQARILPNP